MNKGQTEMKIIVQKFGGTSVHTPELREKAALKLKEAYEEGYSPVAVVSAMGRAGAPYATDTLISIAKTEYEHLDSRNLDILMSTGEIISTVIMTQALRKLGLKAVAVTGWQAGIITDDRFGDATIKRVETKKILSYLEKGYIAVVAGFQGASEDGEITTLGRGGSDTSAVILGVALEAEYVDIFTDVIGVMTADPRIVPEAHILEGLTYTEAAEIIQQGAKVIHDKAMNIAREYRVPLRVRSLNDEGKGTLICDIRSMSKEGLRLFSQDRTVYSIAFRKGLAQFRVKLNGKKEDNLLMFQLLANKGISIDLINLFPDIVAFVVEEGKTVGIIGPNGAGKTTVFNLITGFYRVDRGRILFYGKNITRTQPYKLPHLGIARTFQNLRLFSNLSVFENVLSAILKKDGYNVVSSVFRTADYFMKEGKAEKKARELIEFFQLSGKENYPANNLPYGEQRRLEIARALALQPKILLVDEPGAGMNPREVQDLLQTLREVKERFSLSIVIIEHQMGLVMNISDKVVVMDFGEKIMEGTPGEVKKDKRVIEAYLGEEFI